MPRPSEPRALVGRHVDGLLVGWLAVAVWALTLVLPRSGSVMPYGLLFVLTGIGAVVTAAHFGLSYHLAYGSGVAAVRRRPVVMVVAPVALAAVLAGIAVVAWTTSRAATHGVVSAAVTLVFLLTTWHYVKQVYGVGRVGLGFAGVRVGPGEGRVLRYALYPLWVLGAAQILVRGAHGSLGGYTIGVDLLPGSALRPLQVLALLGAVPVGVVLVRASVRARRWPPSTTLAAYTAAFLWLALPQNTVVTVLVLAPFHALQYLAIGHRAEVALARGRGVRVGPAWWLNIFAGAACGGLLLSRWIPGALDGWWTSDGPLLVTAVVFVFLNLHHYLIDATIWRSDGDLLRAISGRSRPSAATAPAVPAAPAGVS